MLELQLRELTRENYRDVLRLAVAESQQNMVATNAVSVAQAHFEGGFELRGIYEGDVAVGFAMYIDKLEDGHMDLWRFMIDERFQGRGLGAAAMMLLIERGRAQPGIHAILLSHVQIEGNAGPFYEKLGFQPTGEIDGEERIMRFDLVP